LSDTANPYEVSHQSESSFAELLEDAFGNPETFAQKVLPAIKAGPDANISTLVKVFDSSDVVAKNLVADLFRGPLKDSCIRYLLPELSPAHSERFLWASIILADNQIPEALPGLIKILGGAPAPVVLAALKAISRYDRPEAKDAIVEFYLSSGDEVQLSSSIRIISSIAPYMVPKMIERFPRLDKSRKAWVLKFLAEIGSELALGVFADALSRDPCELGVFCIKGLGKIGSAAAVQALVTQLGNKEWFIRKKVVEALGQTHSQTALLPLIGALLDPSVQVRAFAVESLTKVGKLEPALMVDAIGKADHNQKVGLIRAMGQIKERVFLEPLVKTLEDRSLLFFALDSLGDLGFPEAEHALEPFLKDSEWFNRLNALESLAKLHASNLLSWAKNCVEDPNDMVRHAAARIISRMNH